MIRPLRSVLALLVLVAACGAPPKATDSDAPRPIRLVDRFAEAVVQGTPASTEEAPSQVWSFDDTDATAWTAASGVGEMQRVDGELGVDSELRGVSTTDFPLLHAPNPRREGEPHDLVHAVEVRAWVSAGGNLGVDFSSAPEIQPQAVIGRARTLVWPASTPILREGDALQTYVLTLRETVFTDEYKHILLRPTDVAGAEFRIASVRVISRREHLDAIASGPGWHGMGEIYREAVVSRSPETLSYSLDLPSRPRLDLELASLDDRPLTFTVDLTESGEARRLLTRTLTTGQRWESARVDLAPWAGRSIELRLGLEAEEPGRLGFWGTPVVHDGLPETADTGTKTGPNARPRNVLLILADTLRADRLETYGHERPNAPNLTRLAARGTRFDEAFAQATWTKVSVPSILTSLYPLTHGIRETSDRLPAAAVTLPEVFREAGYSTLALSSIYFTGRLTNLHQGFETMHESSSLADDDFDPARAYVDRLLPWLDSHRDVPFFVELHISDPHSPFEPRRPYDTRWTTPAENAAHHEREKKVEKYIESPLMKRFRMPTTDELAAADLDAETYVAHEKALYDASILGMDTEIGRVLERLEELGLTDDTLIVFLADHGEGFLEHGLHWHGNSVYSELARVPLVFAGSGIAAGRVVGQQVQTVDMMPTVLELAGLPIPDGVQGRSLAPLLSGADGDGNDRRLRDLPAFTYKAGRADGHGDTEDIAVVAEGFKLVRKEAPDGTFLHELYSRADDPLEQHDIAADHPEVVERLSAQIEGWLEKTRAARLPEDGEALEGLDPAELERLRSLGYIQ